MSALFAIIYSVFFKIIIQKIAIVETADIIH